MEGAAADPALAVEGLDLGEFDTDKFDDLMAGMMAGMETALDEEEEQATLTVDAVCSHHIPKLWPGDQWREIARGNRPADKAGEPNKLVIVTPKSMMDDLKVAEMFVESWKKGGGDPDARVKAVWAIDKFMNVEAEMKVMWEVQLDLGNHVASEAIKVLQERIHSDLTTSVARALIDEEVRDIRMHLHQHLKHKKNGNQKAGDAAAASAMEIIQRVANIALAFGTKDQSRQLVEMIMKKSAFRSAVAAVPGAAESLCKRKPGTFTESADVLGLQDGDPTA